jgi:hypothetical protein
MQHYAISSFCPDDRIWGFHWPSAGPAEREAVLKDMPKLELFKVLSLPCRHPAHVHWQSWARWVVLEIQKADFSQQDGVVDFRRGVVLFNGPPRQACAFLRQQGLPVPSSLQVQVAGDWETAWVGEDGVAIGGWDAVAQAGDAGVAFAEFGEFGEAIVGERGIAISSYAGVRAGKNGVALTIYGQEATAGDGGLARADEFGTATAGTGGVAIIDAGGTAVAGDSGLAVARWNAAAVAGNNGMAFAWDDSCSGGTVQAGEGGVLLIRWQDGSRYRVAVAHVGEGGIKPNTPYKLNEAGTFVEANNEREGD